MIGRAKGRPDRGFTLSEVLISVGLAGTLATVALALAQTQAGVQREQNRVQAAQDNARAALDVLAHDARLIGALTRGWAILNGAGGPATLPVYQVRDAWNQGADRLELVVPGGPLLTTTSDTAAAATEVDLAPLDPTAPPATTGLSAGDYLLLSNIPSLPAPAPPAFTGSACDTDPARAAGAALLLAGNVPGDGTVATTPLFSGPCLFPRGSLAVRAVAPAYYVDNSAQLVIEDGGALDPLGQGPAAPLAEGIADLQIAVGIDGLNGFPQDGQLSETGLAANDDEWVYNVPGEAAPYGPPSALRITVVARTLVPDGATGPGRPAVEDHAAGPPDRYRYRVLTTTVVPRNLQVIP